MRLGFALIAVVAMAAHPCAGAIRTAFSADKVAVSVDGVTCGALKGWSGGDARAVVGVGAPKHIVGVEYSPLVLEFFLAPPEVIQNWISSFCAGRATAKKIILTESDFNGKAMESTELDNAVLTEVTFSALDASSKDRATVTLVIRPGYRQKIGPTDIGGKSLTNSKAALSANFRFAIPGIPSTRVARIDEITISFGKGPDVNVSNLVVTVAAVEAPGWISWRDAVLGFAPQPVVNLAEKTADVTILSVDLKTDILNLHFDGLSIVGVAPTSTGSSASVPRVQVELACNTVAVAPVVVPPQKEEKKPDAPSAANTSPDDKGVRDPQGFPRPEGLVRHSSTSLVVPTQARETAEYLSKFDFEKLVSSFVTATKGADWMETYRSESGKTPTDRLMMIEWRKGLSVASVRIYAKEGGRSASVDVTTKTPEGAK